MQEDVTVRMRFMPSIRGRELSVLRANIRVKATLDNY